MDKLLDYLGQEIDDPEEETFLLFSQSIHSHSLGIVDSKSTTLSISIGDQELSISQSPTVLSSNRAGGTTGAVVWKVTPRLASWLSSPNNILFQSGLLSSSSTVLELGCGVAALVGLAVGPLVSRYVLTDQPYVSKFVEQNLQENMRLTSSKTTTKSLSSRKNKASQTKIPTSYSSAQGTTASDPIQFRPLDWEQDQVSPALTGDPAVSSFNLVIGCDCIYNEALIKPFVQTSVDACKLRHNAAADLSDSTGSNGGSTTTPRPCVCLVAQQLRDPEIFERWLKEFSWYFHVWQVPDQHLPGELRSNSGFVVHVGFLRDRGS